MYILYQILLTDFKGDYTIHIYLKNIKNVINKNSKIHLKHKYIMDLHSLNKTHIIV